MNELSKDAVSWLTVDADSAGQRVDNFLARVLKGVPKSHLYRILHTGKVRVNKGRVRAETRLAAGDVVRVPPVRRSERASLPKIISSRRQRCPFCTRTSPFLQSTSPPVLRCTGEAAFRTV